MALVTDIWTVVRNNACGKRPGCMRYLLKEMRLALTAMYTEPIDIVCITAEVGADAILESSQGSLPSALFQLCKEGLQAMRTRMDEETLYERFGMTAGN
mmetsp:Transcript_55446/g.89648  ORF Transcript_55446/g.89648 Transcript_55446/m.89648 type:complete len:99 (+) Transcript_55446:366-662(+)